MEACKSISYELDPNINIDAIKKKCIKLDGEIYTMFNYDKDKMFMVWTAKTQNFTNLGIRSVGSCGGTMEIINGVNNQNILCESKNDYGKFYILSRNSRGDVQSNTQKIIFLAGTGIWTEFVGAECTGAYSGAQESHFMWKGKCKVPDSVMENAKKRMINFKKKE